MKLSIREATRLEEIQARAEAAHISREAMSIGAGRRQDLSEEALRHEKTIMLDGGAVAVDNDDVLPGQGYALAQFIANAGPDMHFLLTMVARLMGTTNGCAMPTEDGGALTPAPPVVEVSLPPQKPTYERFMVMSGLVVGSPRTIRLGHDVGQAFVFDVLESPDLVKAFEVGLLVARLDAAPSRWRGAFHVANRHMLERAAKALGYEMKSGEPWEGGIWMFCDFTPQRKDDADDGR